MLFSLLFPQSDPMSVSPYDLAHVDESVRYISSRLPGSPEIALVLGSGLGEYVETLSHPIILPMAEIPHYPQSTVQGHRGRLVYAELGGKRVLAFQGRIHFYECNDLGMVLHPVALAARLGARTLIVTNAAGGVNRQFVPGDLMLITDQIDLMLGMLPAELSAEPAAPAYDRDLVRTAERIALQHGIPIKRGVYVAVKGPSYETAAEVEMIHRLGGDAVGMSTVKEVAFATRMGMRVLGISCITNQATGIGASRLDHSEVTEVANRVKRDFSRLLSALITAL